MRSSAPPLHDVGIRPTASPPGHLILQAPPDFEAPLKQISALVAASILWMAVTLLELVDFVENPNTGNVPELLDVEDGESQDTRKAPPVVASIRAESEAFTEGCKDLFMCFCRTEVELGLGLALLTAWSGTFTTRSLCPVQQPARDRLRRSWYWQRQAKRY
jgi:hypothetical protein